MDSSLSNNPNQQQNSTMIKPFDPSDIDSPGFDPETYVTKLLRESRLTALIDKEQLLTKQIKIYDNEMQTLVYENYNKFISATDTIRQMKKDFKKMEDEMSNLITNMNSINTFNHKIHLTLDVRRQEIRKLTSIHLLLQKIQYLFQLPTKLKEYANLGQYDQAVHTYTKALKALKKYEHIPSFNHIQTTCTDTMNVIREQLKQEFDQQQQASIEVIELLLELGESPDYLSEQFLMQNQQRLQQPLDLMKQQLIVAENQFTTKQQQSSGQVPMDILDFVDSSYNNYLKNVYLFVESYENLFIRNNEISDDEFKERCKYNIETFILNLYDNYLKFIYDLYKSKYYGCDDDTQLYVRSIDRFIRRSTIDINKYMITQRSLEKIKLYLDEFLLYAIECRLKYYHNIIEKHYHEQIIDLRKSLTMLNNNSESNSLSPTIKTVSSSSSPNLMDYVDKMLKQITNDIKQTFQNLSLFLSNDIQFSKKNSTFSRQFSSHYVWDNLFLNLLNKLCSHFEQEYTTNLTVSSVIKSSSSSLYEQSSPPILLLMLSKFVLNFDSSSIPYLCTIFEEKFNIVLESTSQRTGNTNDPSKMNLSTVDRSKLTAVQKHFQSIAKQLLKQYICLQGFTLSQMLRKSIEARDWLNPIEPRHVRSVMKRIIEDLTVIDKQVLMLYNDHPQQQQYGRSNYPHRYHTTSARTGTRSSDSGRRTIIMPRNLNNRGGDGSGSTTGASGSNLMNFHKVFNEKLDIFIDLQFQKTSILSSVIKLLLKTYMECIRLKTFSRYGLQQVQVDINYLYNYLWSFVNNDDRFITNLLEEIISSTVARCLEPILMEASVIEVICERN